MVPRSFQATAALRSCLVVLLFTHAFSHASGWVTRPTEASREFRLPDSSCGPVCLYLAARLLDRPVSLETLLSARCQDSRGCDLQEMCDLAAEHGFSTAVLKVECGQFSSLTSPAIVLYGTGQSGVGHYRLVVGLGGDAFVDADPLGSVRRIMKTDIDPEIRNQSFPVIVVSTNRAERNGAVARVAQPTQSTFEDSLEILWASLALLGACVFSWGLVRGTRRKIMPTQVEGLQMKGSFNNKHSV